MDRRGETGSTVQYPRLVAGFQNCLTRGVTLEAAAEDDSAGWSRKSVFFFVRFLAWVVTEQGPGLGRWPVASFSVMPVEGQRGSLSLPGSLLSSRDSEEGGV